MSAATPNTTPPPDPKNAWSVVQYARRADRPDTDAYLRLSFDKFCELRGDRRYRDDPSIRGGIAWMNKRALVVIGHRRGRDAEDRTRCNFGMPFPEGYHKALRLMAFAEHFRLAVVTLIDTPGAYPGLGAEERGQAGAIATLLCGMARLEIPTVSVVIGQGGSGGALALGLADRVLMLEYAVYSVISPEGCASILWHSTDRAPEAAASLRMTAHELHELGIVDEVIPEPETGIAGQPRQIAMRVREAVIRHLRELRTLAPDERIRRRSAKYAAIGMGTVDGAP